jgi:CheY-like chemotaxis protein
LRKIPHCILVVDDDAENAHALANALALELRCEVVTAYDGAVALDKACEHRPEVIVMDIGMPMVNGIEAGKLLRRLFNGHAPRMLALTGRNSEEDRRAIRECGFEQHFVKPVDLNQLVAAIVGHGEEKAA